MQIKLFSLGGCKCFLSFLFKAFLKGSYTTPEKKVYFFAGAEDGDFLMKGYLTGCTSLPQHLDIARQVHADMSTFFLKLLRLSCSWAPNYYNR